MDAARPAFGFKKSFRWKTSVPQRASGMAARKKDRDLERTYSRAQFVAKLRRLADAIETKRPFTIQVAGERFRISADAVFNIEHESSGDEEELEFQLKWKSDKRTN
jgi:amphi-Trp domain-containing protein